METRTKPTNFLSKQGGSWVVCTVVTHPGSSASSLPWSLCVRKRIRVSAHVVFFFRSQPHSVKNTLFFSALVPSLFVCFVDTDWRRVGDTRSKRFFNTWGSKASSLGAENILAWMLARLWIQLYKHRFCLHRLETSISFTLPPSPDTVSQLNSCFFSRKRRIIVVENPCRDNYQLRKTKPVYLFIFIYVTSALQTQVAAFVVPVPSSSFVFKMNNKFKNPRICF